MSKKVFLLGLLAIVINTILLQIALPVFHIQAENGGLLKLALKLFSLQGVSFLKSKVFAIVFHFVIGVSMVWFYEKFFAKNIHAKPWVKGVLFSFIPWLLNSAVVLPLLHQGFAGYRVISDVGMMYFFIVNLLFGLILGILIRT